MAKPETHQAKFCNLIATVKYTSEGLDGGDYGMTRWAEADIIIKPTGPPREQLDTLLHEVLHLILEDCDTICDMDVGYETQEKIIQEVAPRLLDFLSHAWVVAKLAEVSNKKGG